MFEYVVPADGGAGYCLAGGRHLLAIADGLQSRIPRLWSLLGEPDTRLEDLFDALAGQGVSAAPEFAIAEIVDAAAREVRALVHGDAIAQAHGAPISGAGLATWRESTWHGVDGLMIGLASARPGVETLPLTAGVVRADWVRWRPRDEAAAGAAETRAQEFPSTAEPTARTAPDAAPEPADRPVATPAIRLGDGEPLGLDLPIVLGRRPEAGLTEAGAPTVPVAVVSPRRLVSGVHLLVEREGAGVRLRDLGAKNGSLVRRPDGSRVLLRDGEQLTVPIGTRVELGDDVVLEVVERPDAQG